MTELTRIGKIGEGTYGIVYSANMGLSPVAVKRNLIDANTNFIGSIRELDVLLKLRHHPNIVKLLDIRTGNLFTDKLTHAPVKMTQPQSKDVKDDIIHFIFERSQTDLHHYIHSKDYNISAIKKMMTQILLAVDWVHSRSIIHRDIKPSNILVFSDGTVKLCDFGLSKPYTRFGTQTPRAVTCWYRAPEIILNNPYYTLQTDMWSVGCVFYEMVARKALLYNTPDIDTRLVSSIFDILPDAPDTKLFQYTDTRPIRSPLRRTSLNQLINYTPDQVEAFNKTSGIFDQFIDLLSHLLIIDPDQRWTSSQALSHPFIHQEPKYSQCTNMPIIVKDCLERKIGGQIIMNLFHKRSTLSWYRHRILFQAFDIWDRYLASLNTPSTLSIEMRFYVCIYLCIKYFTTMSSPISYANLIDVTPEELRNIEQFEFHLVGNVLNYKIYQNTLYELVDHGNDDRQIENLLLVLTSVTSYSGLTAPILANLYKEAVSIHHR